MQGLPLNRLAIPVKSRVLATRVKQSLNGYIYDLSQLDNDGLLIINIYGHCLLHSFNVINCTIIKVKHKSKYYCRFDVYNTSLDDSSLGGGKIYMVGALTISALLNQMSRCLKKFK